MYLPKNFQASPSENPQHYFRNLCLSFMKTIKTTKDKDQLLTEMEKFINASRDLDWHPKTSSSYHKSIGEKATNKVWTEFKRYISNNDANPEDLLNALEEVNLLIRAEKAT